MMGDADAILRRQTLMEQRRTSFEGLWQDVAEHLLPRQAEQLTGGVWPGSTWQGARRTRRIYDETAMLALDNGIAVFEGYVIPRGSRWQMLEPRDESLRKNRRVREWYETVTGRLFSLRTAPNSGFDTQTHESVASLLAFGFQGMWPDLLRDAQGRVLGLFYRSEHIGGLYVLENAWGRVDVVHRKFSLTARQARQKWGDAAPECVDKAERDQRADETSHIYIHALEPRTDHEPGRIDARGKPIRSAYVSVADRAMFDEGGYRAMPLIASRYEKSPTEDYGRSPGINVLPAVKATQAMMRDLVAATELMARPPLLAHDDMLDQTIRYMPDGVTYGGLDSAGNPTVQRMLAADADLSAPLMLQERTREIIKRAFFEDLLRVRQEQKTHLIAADVYERIQEKGILLAPLGRQETEWFSPMLERELDLMGEMGQLDDMPPEVREAGGLFQVRYENPLTRAQRAESAAGFFRTLEGVTPMIQAKPALLDAFLERYPFDKLLAGLADINGVPASWEADEAERAAMRAASEEAAAGGELLAAAPVVSKVAADLARAGMGGGDGGIA